MDYKRILSIQDISCVGQCSLTVALPILSACGHETAILPAAVLSNHTGGFKGFTCHDLTSDIPGILEQWETEGIAFDGAYTGYLGSSEQIAYVKDIFDRLVSPDGLRVVDPAMADSGTLYPAFDMDFVEVMKSLVAAADIALPNITEASLLTGIEYRKHYDRSYANALIDGIHALGTGTVIMTGVSYDDTTTGILVSDEKGCQYIMHEKLPVSCHGTGDVFASAFVGAYLAGKGKPEAAKIAGEYVLSCIRNTIDDQEHWYGVKFEPMLGELITAIRR